MDTARTGRGETVNAISPIVTFDRFTQLDFIIFKIFIAQQAIIFLHPLINCLSKRTSIKIIYTLLGNLSITISQVFLNQWMTCRPRLTPWIQQYFCTGRKLTKSLGGRLKAIMRQLTEGKALSSQVCSGQNHLFQTQTATLL